MMQLGRSFYECLVTASGTVFSKGVFTENLSYKFISLSRIRALVDRTICFFVVVVVIFVIITNVVNVEVKIYLVHLHARACPNIHGSCM